MVNVFHQSSGIPDRVSMDYKIFFPDSLFCSFFLPTKTLGILSAGSGMLSLPLVL